MNTEFEVLREGRVELVKVLLVLGDLADKVKGLLDEILSDDLSVSDGSLRLYAIPHL